MKLKLLFSLSIAMCFSFCAYSYSEPKIKNILYSTVFVNSTSKPFLKGDTIIIVNLSALPSITHSCVLNFDFNPNDTIILSELNDTFIRNPNLSGIQYIQFVNNDSSNGNALNAINKPISHKCFVNSKPIFIDDFNCAISLPDFKVLSTTYAIEVLQSVMDTEILISRFNYFPKIPLNYSILSNLGQELANGTFIFELNSTEATLRLSNIKKGSYSITIGEGSDSFTSYFQIK